MPFADVTTLAQPPHAVVAPVATTPWTVVTVRRGDTLWDIAVRHRTSVAALVEKNRLAGGGGVIHAGQRILVPGKPPSPGQPGAAPTSKAGKPVTPKPPTVVHVVRPGETMSGIALHYRVSLTKLLAANKLRNAHLIHAGQRIAVPTRASTAEPTHPAPNATPPPGYSYPSKTARSVAASKARLADTKVPTRAETAALIRAAATRHGVDPKLALAIGWLESGWDQRAVSYTDAVGVMQIMPTSSQWASELAGRRLDRYDARDNITAGVLILRALRSVANSPEESIAGYYQGLRSVRTKGMYEDTKAYVATVLAVYGRL